MAPHLVVGTAGHIDHGKTALVRSLTGVDTDRLAEEKRRGITIDLGFAPLDLGTATASVVDVPGHEGFVRNMVAGATGVDLALLVVAADEGVMPQTLEHLAILRLLGVVRGVVALAKCDLADPEWRALVAADVAERVQVEMGEPWPIVPVSVVTGEGLDALRVVLAERASAVPPHPEDDLFRLPVDRVFSLAGAGTVVTGTVWTGTAAEGDTVTVLPVGQRCRVRSVEVHGQRGRALPGRRAALGLVGLDRAGASRGALVVRGDGWRGARALEARVEVLRDAPRPLERRSRVRLHHGTAEVMARVVPAGGRIPPGSAGLARLLLEQPIVARAGDRFVLRWYSPVVTIGGGLILDPWADDPHLVRRRAAPALARDLEPDADPARRVAALAGRRGRHGLSREEAAVASGLPAPTFGRAVREAVRLGLLIEAEDRLMAAGEVGPVAAKLEQTLAEYLAANPLEAGMPAQAWRKKAGAVPRVLLERAEGELIERGAVEREGALVRVPGWRPGESPASQRAQEAVLRLLRDAGAQPPTVAELAQQVPDADVAGTLRLLAARGEVVTVAAGRYYERNALEEQRLRLVAVLNELGAATPAVLRERMGLSRKWLIPLLEWTDRVGLTIRRGDARVLSKRAPPLDGGPVRP